MMTNTASSSKSLNKNLDRALQMSPCVLTRSVCALDAKANRGQTEVSAARADNNGNGNGFVHTSSIAPAAVGSEEETVYSADQVFNCPEESLFYSQCLQRVLGGGLVGASSGDGESSMIVEFGAGDGSPVIDALLKTKSRFRGFVHGFELNPRAAGVAHTRCNQLGLNGQYVVRNSCFFKGAEELRTDASWLVANPPYIAAPTDKSHRLLMPELHGGETGSELTNKLLTLGYPNTMLLISSYSNPLETLRVAKEQGYSVSDFLVCPMPFGYYSSQPLVKDWLRQMKGRGQAFFSDRAALGSDGWYLLAGVILQKSPPVYNAATFGKDNGHGNTTSVLAQADASEELIKVLTSLR